MNDTNTLLPHIKLRFNIEHPSFEECYTYGYECSLAELDEAENPYSEGSFEHEQWREGWWAGFYGETPLFEGSEQTEASSILTNKAANDHFFNLFIHLTNSRFLTNMLKITGALAATAVVGYQVLEFVA